MLSRDELLTLPEFVLLSLFPNGLFPDGHMGGFVEGEAVQVDVRHTFKRPQNANALKWRPAAEPGVLTS